MTDLFLENREKLFSLKKYRFENSVRSQEGAAEGERTACKNCEEIFGQDIWEKNLYVCPKCGHHHMIGGRARLGSVLDKGSFLEKYKDLKSENPLKFPGYDKKLKEMAKELNENDALICGTGRISGIKVCIAVLNPGFLMGSMGTVVGEKLVRIIEDAAEKKHPLVIFSASGGARMQEGLFSLMQMARTSAAIEQFSLAGGLYISVLTNPTTGGVSASFASLGDIILAEPGALIGFAGPRVIKQTIGQELPEGFQRAEFQEDHGFVDQVVNRCQMKEVITKILRLHGGENE